MPTFGWIYENAVERFWEGQPSREPVSILQRRMLTCKWCQKEFTSAELLHHHLSLAHSLELPTLYIFGKPLLKESVVRSSVGANDVELFQCSHCEVQVNNGLWQHLGIQEFCNNISSTKNARWNVRLVHERAADNSQAVAEYAIRFGVPDVTMLDAVDRHFIQTLALEELNHGDLERFKTGLPSDTSVHEYGCGLGDYALGIILKERRQPSYAPINSEEFAVKMRSALEVLCHFQRPMAVVVSNSIRFNLNDFRNYGVSTAAELEAALDFFRGITGEHARNLSDSVSSISKKTLLDAICPIDYVSHHILLACGRYASGHGVSIADLEDLEQLLGGTTPVSKQDSAKIHAICAEGYLQLGLTADARRHLIEIQFQAMLKEWAQRRLEEIVTDAK